MKKLLIILLLAFLFRIGLTDIAHHGDLNNNISWGDLLVERGPVDFYGSSDANDWPYSAPNQPPLTLLLLGTTSLLYDWIDITIRWTNNQFALFPSGLVWFWEVKGADLTVKLPGMLADIAIGYVIYKYIKKKTEKEKLAIGVLIVWLFNPVTWYNSSIWGQTDSIVNLLGLVGIIALLENKLTKFAVFFTLSLLFKGSLAIFIPILLVITILQKYQFKDWLLALCYSLLTTILISVWFHPQIDLLFWFVNLYTTRILPGEIGYLTANAFNFWWLVDSGKVLDSTVYFGLSARAWGLIGAIAGLLSVGLWLTKSKLRTTRVLFALTAISLISFLFMTRIHERYLYPFFPYATILLGFVPWMYLPYTIFSVIHLLNLYHLFWAPGIPWLIALYKNEFFMTGLAMLNLLFFAYLILKQSLTTRQVRQK